MKNVKVGIQKLTDILKLFQASAPQIDALIERRDKDEVGSRRFAMIIAIVCLVLGVLLQRIFGK